MTGGTRLVKELGVDQVHLAQVGLERVTTHARAVLHVLTRVRVALDAAPGHERDRLHGCLAEPVLAVAADSDDPGR
ncbi:hypothetical protein GCM10007231_30530 [Nocardioides daphniae]|uniref:Uncharacterized protein n=1 Tax=Nocardioides daphniae TaxID=402297 RepID=A0ABQ1QJ10_9ACTN|nr:hypothetical protein GCM10007231_30530 [Nocardioides daphniae]